MLIFFKKLVHHANKGVQEEILSGPEPLSLIAARASVHYILNIFICYFDSISLVIVDICKYYEIKSIAEDDLSQIYATLNPLAFNLLSYIIMELIVFLVPYYLPSFYLKYCY